MNKNILLTGLPGTGKTTAIRRIVEGLDITARGFYTEEIREGNRRTGFMIRTLDGSQGYLAHVDIKGSSRVSKYGVSVENINSIAVPSIRMSGHRDVIVIDEIGKMECFSDEFKHAVICALDSSNIVLGTIAQKGGGFISAVKKRSDISIIEITRTNRDNLLLDIIRTIRSINQ